MRVGDIFLHRDIFISSDRCLWPVWCGPTGLAYRVLVKIMTMSWHPFSVMWQILSGYGHLMKVRVRKVDSDSAPADRTGGQTWPAINMTVYISPFNPAHKHLISITHWHQKWQPIKNEKSAARPLQHQTGGQKQRKREAFGEQNARLPNEVTLQEILIMTPKYESLYSEQTLKLGSEKIMVWTCNYNRNSAEWECYWSNQWKRNAIVFSVDTCKDCSLLAFV